MERQTEIGEKGSKHLATPWGWTLPILKLFTFFIHVII